MTKPIQPPSEDVAQVQAFCAAQSPEHLHDQVRVEMVRRGRTVTIVEHQRFDADWIDVAVARMRFDPDTGRWTLFWPDRNGRFHRYEDLGPAPISRVLREVDRDPFGTFWG